MKRIATIIVLIMIMLSNNSKNSKINDNPCTVKENNYKIITLDTINVEYQQDDIQTLLDDGKIVQEDKTNIVYAHNYVVNNWFNLESNDIVVVDGVNYMIVDTANGYTDYKGVYVNEENIIENRLGDITLVTCADNNGGRYIV